MTRQIEINIFDAHFGIWQDNANDKSFHDEIFGGLTRLLRQRGWKVGSDPNIKKHYRCLNATHRLARKGDLRAVWEITGRCIKFEVWSETWPLDNQNGRRYDFGKFGRLSPIERRMVLIEFANLRRWLSERCTIASLKNSHERTVGPHFGGITAREWVRRDAADCWHADTMLRRTKVDYRRNGGCEGRSGDKEVIHQGMRVWFIGSKGRIERGHVYYALNSNWHVVVNKYDRRCIQAWEILVNKPADIRCKRNLRARRDRLDKEMAKAVSAMEFERAATLRDLIFGKRVTRQAA